MKIALVHDYLFTYGGGERVLELFHSIYPNAPIYTIMYDKNEMPDYFRTYPIKTSFINTLPFKNKHWKNYIPLMPIAVESFDFSDFDVVLSITSGFSKGILTGISTCHISYTLTVPRYLWGYETSTQGRHKGNILFGCINNYLRLWDKAAADRVDFFIANSNTVKRRILKSYGRNAKVVYSAVDEDLFSLSSIRRENFYLIVSRLEPYKHIDLAIKTCREHHLKLVIIGSGSQRRHLEDIAKGKVDFLGHVPDDIILRYFKSAKAVIFPGADDLGLVPIEAQMCGTPVIAYRKDGALETIQEGIGGVFFDEQTNESLWEAMERLDMLNLSASTIRESVMKFAQTGVKKELRQFIANCHESYVNSYGIM